MRSRNPLPFCGECETNTSGIEPTTSLFGAIEAGGTKFVCAIGSSPTDVQAEKVIPTTTPEETIERAIDFFQESPRRACLAAIGIGSFGPVDLNSASPSYGFITTTPKPGWAQTDLVGPIRKAIGLPVGFDTDVNVAALGESEWGAAQGLGTFIYITVGTGIGGGGMVNGRLMHGLLHPEMGHIRVPHDLNRDPYPGACSFHSDCLEGLAAGPALTGRWGQPGEMLPPEHPAWKLEAHYLALGLANLICALSPQRIILGGGIMQQDALLSMIRREVQQLLNGYLQTPMILDRIDDYIVKPTLGKRSGILGAIALASRASSIDKRDAVQ